MSNTNTTDAAEAVAEAQADSRTSNANHGNTFAARSAAWRAYRAADDIHRIANAQRDVDTAALILAVAVLRAAELADNNAAESKRFAAGAMIQQRRGELAAAKSVLVIQSR